MSVDTEVMGTIEYKWLKIYRTMKEGKSKDGFLTAVGKAVTKKIMKTGSKLCY